MLKKLAFVSLALTAALSLSACTADGSFRSPAASPAPIDLSDPGRENSTPSTIEMGTYGVRDSAFPAGSRDTSTD